MFFWAYNFSDALWIYHFNIIRIRRRRKRGNNNKKRSITTTSCNVIPFERRNNNSDHFGPTLTRLLRIRMTYRIHVSNTVYIFVCTVLLYTGLPSTTHAKSGHYCVYIYRAIFFFFRVQQINITQPIFSFCFYL